MKTKLFLQFPFVASHSLSGYEAPHPHLWRLEVSIKGTVVEGKIIDIVYIREKIEALISPLKDTYLNENLTLNDAARKTPTCETLSGYFWDQVSHLMKAEFHQLNPSIQLDSIGVAIGDLDGKEMGLVLIEGS